MNLLDMNIGIEKSRPLISIVTVTFNNYYDLEKTVQSVISQTYDNIEYIVIDGGSTDNTLQVLRKYEEKIFYMVSERDDGIYDAMNKGQKIANGDYVFFLNGGDVFASEDVLEDIFSKNEILDRMPLLVMGKIECEYNQQSYWVSSVSNKINIQFSPPHQAMFIQKEIYKKYDYNKYFRILGDRDYWLRLFYDKCYNVEFVDKVISKYSLDGVSSKPKNSIILIKEIMILSILYLKEIEVPILLKEICKAMIKTILYYTLGTKKYYKFLGRFVHRKVSVPNE